ncbi:MAG: T9SS type A sorting domain-containing protein [Bacteroidota bacterium]|nr:T9SS type A sorting domain-containing protein [Bacteroidota bacterium]
MKNTITAILVIFSTFAFAQPCAIPNTLTLQYTSACNNWASGTIGIGKTLSGTYFSIPAGLPISNNQIILSTSVSPANYQIYFITSGNTNPNCDGLTSSGVTFTVKAPYTKPNGIGPFGYPSSSYCKDVNGKISPIGIDPNVGTGRTSSFTDLANGANGPVLTSINGQFDPTASTTLNANGQNYTIQWQVNEPQCNAYTEQTTVKVVPRQIIPRNIKYNQSANPGTFGVCSDQGNIALVSPITVLGANWTFAQLSNIGGVVVDGNTGIVQVPTFIPGTSGNDRVRLIIIGLSLSTTGANNCPTDHMQFTITVTSKVNLPNVLSFGGLNSFGVYCADANVPPTSAGSFSGGEFSYTTFDNSEGGFLSINPVTGTLSPSESSPGKYRIQYIVPQTNACGVQSVVGTEFIITNSQSGTISGLSVCNGQSGNLILNGIRPNSVLQWQNKAYDGSWVNYQSPIVTTSNQAFLNTPTITSSFNPPWRASVTFLGCLSKTSNEVTIQVNSTTGCVGNSGTTYIDFLEKDYSIQIFPNPSHGSFTIVNNNQGAPFEIYNYIGNPILAGVLNGGKHFISHHFESGIYLLRIGTKTYRISIQ